MLDRLYADSSTYVRTSVANHLQDLAGTQPELVLATLRRWEEQHSASDQHFAFIARTALWSRLKKGSPDAYAFLGYPHDAPLELTPLVLERTEPADGDVLSFSAALTATVAVTVDVMFVFSSTTPHRQAAREGLLPQPHRRSARPAAPSVQAAQAAVDGPHEDRSRPVHRRDPSQRPPLSPVPSTVVAA
ncbi:hypothetical protein ABT144_34260 [Streptomyces sp. NPDC002039]|uniref:hypothetical protein n=1 Tax=Streptomyces sp. NPDC002039 TaxID=3154660 RepID=UPI0033203153